MYTVDINTLAKGIIIGLSIAAPVGPIGVLCIRRTLTHGRLFGLVSGVGAATADAIYGMIAAFGLTFISNILISQNNKLQIIGGIFLCYLGVKTLRSKASDKPATAKTGGLFGSYLSTLLLTITNPMTILSFAGIFAGLGVSTNSPKVMVAGVFLGSLLWWFILSFSVGIFKDRMSSPAMTWINRISGITILIFGIVALTIHR